MFGLRFCLLCVLWSLMTGPVSAAQPLKLLDDPQLSPDGKTLLFVHRGDIWRVSSHGGLATRVTFHPSDDSQPRFSPDGQSIAYVSDRTGSPQVYVMREGDAAPRQVSWHTEGYGLQGWFPDGRHLLVTGNRDHSWKYSQRLFRIDSQQRSAEELLFNDTVNEAQCSPDGTQLIFSMGGERWWRKGYRGARASQIWLFEFSKQRFTTILKQETESLSPLWRPDGNGFFYCSSQESARGARNLWEFDLRSQKKKQITHFDDDLVSQPTISGDGKTIIFSHLFDLYRLDLADGIYSAPHRLDITVSLEDEGDDVLRRRMTEATDAAITDDGLEVAFIAGGDLWVMETVLREPVQITSTAGFESHPMFVEKDRAILCVSCNDSRSDIVKITRKDESRYWWQNSEFNIVSLTQDAASKSELKLSPDRKKLAYIRDRGDLWLLDLELGTNEKIISGFSLRGFDFSPDSRWITYAQDDNDFNSDIWIKPLDGSAEAVNISRHPADEINPHWSPDGKVIAFTGRRADREEIDIYYVYLTLADHDEGPRNRKLSKTLEAFSKSRQDKNKTEAASQQEENVNEGDPKETSDEKSSPDKNLETAKVVIDWEMIHRRIRQLSIPDSSEGILGWIPGSKKLLFTATVDGQKGTYQVEFPEELKPKKISAETGNLKGWLKSPERFLWISGGQLATVAVSAGSAEKLTFSALQEISLSGRMTAAFEASWRAMKDWWYDDNFGNNNWDAIGRKYAPVAQSTNSLKTLTKIIHLMLGELNGSHLGFSPFPDVARRSEAADQWRPLTGHLGARMDAEYLGPGWKIKEVIEGGPASSFDSRLIPGEIIVSVDGVAVDPQIDPSEVLTGPMERDIVLKVRGLGPENIERDVRLRPATYSRIRSLLYQKWQDDNRKIVEERSKKQNIGYVHIEGMNWSSFLEFQRELFEVGYGKDGLIIDVRDNGGGSTTDHLLTSLTQPRHSITVPRGGGPGYPSDRMVYTIWHKPIVVLCNQNSYSNAEIFSHAIKTLGRGKLVGVPTAGGVISTGSITIMDVGTLRRPYRGWFLKSDGQDMELNGAVPDIVVWPKPTEIHNGRDRQLNRAIKELEKSIREWKREGEPELVKATERKRSDH
jgi:tricorn protease